VDGHLDTCATHCFVSHHRSTLLQGKGYPPIKIKPFPIGQGARLPDATTAHLAPLRLVSKEGQVVGFGTVLFLVSNTGGDILIANNILDFLGILRYHPPMGYEQILQEEARLSFIPLHKRSPPGDIKQEVLQAMLREGQCLFTESTLIEMIAPMPHFKLRQNETYKPDVQIGRNNLSHRNEETIQHQQAELKAAGIIQQLPEIPEYKITEQIEEDKSSKCQRCGKHIERCKCETQGKLSSKQGEPESELGKGASRSNRQEIRQQKIQKANNLKVGKEPPPNQEITNALNLLKRISESPPEQIYSRSEIEDLQKELSKNRPEWAGCLTSANTQQATKEEQWAKTQIEEMMDGRFKETVFGKTLKTPCNFKPFEIHTKAGSDPEKAVQPRRFKDPKITQLIDDWVEGLLKDGLIEESQTSVAAPVTVVLKKGRDPRVCIDYRERNERTETPIYPMPDVHDFLDDAAGFQYYCSFDCAKMFNQYEIVKEHRHLAAFMTQKGTYEPSRIMFGVTGGPQHAVRSVRPALKLNSKTNGTLFTQWALEQNEKGENPPYIIDPKTKIVPGSRLDIFVDDCRILSNNLRGLVKLCELWFEFCEEHLLILSRKKAKLCLKHLPFLGFVVSALGKHLDPNRISSLMDIPIPTSKEGLHALLCSYNFVRIFIPEFSIIASPLYAATKGIIWKGPGSGRSRGTREYDPEFQWNDTLDRALRQLKQALLRAPILVTPDYSKALFLSVDACLKGEGWVLWQIIKNQNGAFIPVAIHYGSTKYSDTESAWEVTRQEAHAIQSALKDVHDYIFSCHFYLLTDHRNLTFLSSSVNRAVIRIRHFMQQFNMTVVHVPGSWNNPADGISRLETELLPIATVTQLISSTTVESENLLCTQRGQDPGLPIMENQDYVIEVGKDSASVFFTSGNFLDASCHQEDCILCNPLMIEESSSEAFCLISQAECLIDINEWDDDWDLIEQVQNDLNEAQVFLTRNQARKQAKDWNLKRQESVSITSIIEPTIGPEEAEWIPETTELRKFITVSKAWIEVPLKEITPTFPDQTKPCFGIVHSATQTSPADFRSLSIRLPMTEDFKAIHNNEIGHHGFEHSYRKLMIKFGSKWAEGKETATYTAVRNDLKTFLKNCPICQKVRGLQEKIKSKHSFVSSRPFIEVSYDFVVFEKIDRNGNRYLIVAVDNFTKLVEMKPTPTRGADNVAQFLLELKSRYGPINRLRSDREKAFTSLIVSRLNELTGTDTIPCIVYHPQANSVCERQNQIIMNHLRSLVYGAHLGTDSMYSWSDLIPIVFSIVNNTPKSPLAISPLSMVYGIFSNFDRPLLPPRPLGEITNPVDYVDGLVEWQNKLLEIAEEIQSKHFEKLLIKTKVEYKSFQEGDFVLQLKTATGIRGKLITRWIGPRLVLNRRNNDPNHPVLDLFDLVTSQTVEASIDDCRLFHTGWFDEPTMVQDLHRLAALDKEEYEVESILIHRVVEVRTGTKPKPSDYWFLVKWAGFSEEENSWEPYATLKTLSPLEEYLSKHPELKL
jgi:hypothetical protein